MLRSVATISAWRSDQVAVGSGMTSVIGDPLKRKIASL